MEKKDKMGKNEKKKLSLKEIGIERLVIMLLSGVFIVILSVPSLFKGSSNQKKENSSSNVSSEIAKQQEDNIDETTYYTNQLEKRLKEALKKVEGIGDVEVMITLKSSKELVPLKDAPYSQDTINEVDGSGGSRISSNVSNNEESVLIRTEEGEQVPYIIKEIEPIVEGVVVIAHGGNDPAIVVEIIDAVEVLFDVPTHKIKVMKMNSR